MTHLCVEDLVFHDIKVHCKEAGLQSSAESVTLHQADLGIGRLVTQQVFLGRNHILQNLKKRPMKKALVLSLHLYFNTHL